MELETLKLKKTGGFPVNSFRNSLILAFLIALSAGSPAKAATSTAKPVSGPTNYEMVEAPTAYILMHGGYDFVSRIYDNGGFFLRANIGFEDFFMCGFSGNASNLIGNGTIQIQTPRLFLKFKILDQKNCPVALAVAWDDRGYGAESGGRFSPGLQKGFYSVVSHEFSELGYLQVHGGINAVKFDNFNAGQDLGAFAGTSFAVAPPLAFNFELDKLFTDFWQFNANVVFNVDNPLRVGVDFREINRPSTFSRIIRVQYINFF